MQEPVRSASTQLHRGYAFNELAEIMNGQVLRMATDTRITRIDIDSRKLHQSESSLFFALRGPRHDGHHFIRELYERGVRNFVVSSPRENVDLLYEANVIQVEDSLEALQKLAAHHRSSFDLPAVGITGSNGKTVVKEWLYQLLQARYYVVRSPRSYNSQVGVPLSVWNISREHSLGLFEAGISKPGEMARLASVIQPNVGVFINIRHAHDAQFENRKQKAREKLELFRHCQTLIYQGDYTEISESIAEADWTKNIQLVRCSLKDPNADYFAEVKMQGDAGTTLALHASGKEYSVRIPFGDEGSVENALLCFAAASVLGLSPEETTGGLESLQPVAMRLQLLEGVNHCGLINDAYNSDMGSLEIALDFANRQRFLPKKSLILSDILQSGASPEALYKQVNELCVQKGIARIIGVGAVISQHADAFTIPATFYPDTDALLAALQPDWFNRELILVKGARPFRFERITRLLQHKSHETMLEINLDALVHNLNFFRSKLQPSTRIMAMVKAFSYGMGSYELAHLLEYQKISHLAVAYADEGVALRKAGVQLPIMVMNPEVSGYAALVKHRLEPEIYSFRTLEAFRDAAKTSMVNPPYPIHIKLDTGMNRLGFRQEELNQLAQVLQQNPGLHVASVFSHLAAADNGLHDDFTHEQARKFITALENLKNQLGYSFLRHLLNTSGILRFPQYQLDMVRLGIGLYGYGIPPELKAELMESSRMKTVISQIKTLQPGESVGYQRAAVVDSIRRIATIPVGYADGFPRALGNGKGEVAIAGFRAPTVGNVCMDMCMVDVTNIPCREGDEVEIFGSDVPLNEMATRLNTIPYEVISGISQRVKRVYYHD
ncbi:MAG: bifunctional UDP-N-acetylmuramoyl-tripeptide:D-alanyl-D-alanine ligase/alanine racemase [Cryomorphaceae bacterium]|nr:MAG: bifunctional UDP-N-acetylmuramoyl-tripeptide:D-alanyl-D-alanine ligase/alanine racemase [Cryomorphaceae bacterium]